MARRKGLGKGKGKGYKNMMGKDPAVHSQSARGIKQPQRVRMNIKKDILKNLPKDKKIGDLIAIDGEQWEVVDKDDDEQEYTLTDGKGNTRYLDYYNCNDPRHKMNKGKQKRDKSYDSCMTDQQVWEERHGYYYDDDR